MKNEDIATSWKHSTEVDYLVFTSAHMSFAISYHSLVQIVDRPECVSIPSMPQHVRGAVDFMGKPLMLLDMRKIFGGKSMIEEVDELAVTIAARKQDHLNWINKLKDAVYNDKEITVETNPHKCAFGKWYDNFKSDSVTLEHFLRRFDKPHRTIHNLAVEAKELIRNGKKAQASDLIHRAEANELQYLIALFDSFEANLKELTYEYALVINCNDQKLALAVDALRFFDKFDEVIPKLPSSMDIADNHLIEALGRKKIGDDMEDILIINCDNLNEIHTFGSKMHDNANACTSTSGCCP